MTDAAARIDSFARLPMGWALTRRMDAPVEGPISGPVREQAHFWNDLLLKAARRTEAFPGEDGYVSVSGYIGERDGIDVRIEADLTVTLCLETPHADAEWYERISHDEALAIVGEWLGRPDR